MLARLVRPARTRLALPAARWCSAADVQLETFHRAADSTLQGIQEVIEDYADETPTQEIDVEFSGEVLNVGLGARGTFVLNKQTPNQQIWLSSPVSGPLRYDFLPDTVSWYCRREGKALLPMLTDDLETLIGVRLSFDEVEQELRDAVKR